MQCVEDSYSLHMVSFYKRTPSTSHLGQDDICSVTSSDLMSRDMQHRDNISASSDLDICLHSQILKGQTALWSSEVSLPPGWLSYLAAISLTAPIIQTASHIDMRELYIS